MKTIECGYLMASSLCLSAAIVGLLNPTTTHAAQLKSTDITAAQAAEIERVRYQAELRREANWSGLTRKEIAKVKALLAARKARADREAALYEQFKFQQKLALAEAMVPLIGRLHRDHGVVVTVHGRSLVGKSVTGIVKAHRFARRVDDVELPLEPSSSRMSLANSTPPPRSSTRSATSNAAAAFNATMSWIGPDAPASTLCTTSALPAASPPASAV